MNHQEEAIFKLKKVLSDCEIFSGHKPSHGAHDNVSTRSHMIKLMSKEIIPESAQESILSTHKVVLAAFHKFVEERVTGSENLWAKMTEVKL